MIDKKLIDKFYEGKCTPDEAQRVLGWFEEQDKGERSIEEYWYRFEQEYDAKYSSRQLAPSLSDTQSFAPTFWQNQWFKVAAILLLVFSLALLWSTFDKQAVTTAPVAVEMIEKETLAGQKTTFQLPDGSLVTLNAESRLTYPEHFEGAIRKVALTGEAFFDVAENFTKPFIVAARGVNTQALGTSFNIRAYEDEPKVEVVLATGKVKVDFVTDEPASAYLVPGEKIVADNDEQTLQKSEANLQYVLGWKDNILHFREATSERVFSTLERWYGVEISRPELAKNKNWQFTGEFQNENLENVLTSIGYAKNFQFKIQQKNITIIY